MRVLVTGGAGFIASHVVDLLVTRGHVVDVLDDFSSGQRENLSVESENLRVLRGDVRLFPVNDKGYDSIAHLAAQPSLLRSLQEPALDAEINILGTLRAIGAAKRSGAKVVFSSTSAVYDSYMSAQTYHEDSLLGPTRPYGIAKLAAELYVKNSGLPYCILRFGNVYGERQTAVGENQIIPRALDHVYKAAPFVVNGDGEQTRDFVYVRDVADAVCRAVGMRDPGGTFNVGTGRGTSVNDVLSLLRPLTHFAGEFRHGPPKPDEPRHVALNSNRALRVLSWRAETLLSDGLRRTVEWYKGRLAA